MSKLLFTVLLGLGLVCPSQAAIALVAHTTGYGTGNNSGTITTTGATLLIAVVGDGAPSPSVSDNLGNTWHSLTIQNYSGAGLSQVFYSYDHSGSALSTGSDYITVYDYYPAFMFSAWSGTLTSPSNPFDLQNGSTVSSGTIQPGSVTPSFAGALVITGLGGYQSASDTISGGFSVLDDLPYAPGLHFAGATGYQIQTSIAAANPTWTVIGPGGTAATIASFTAAPPGSPGFPVVY